MRNIGILSLILVPTLFGCIWKRSAGDSTSRAQSEEAMLPARPELVTMAREQHTYLVDTAGALTYSWSYSDSALENRQKYIANTMKTISQNQRYDTAVDLPPGLNVGHGVYAAGDPFVSASYGDILFVLRLRSDSLFIPQEMFADWSLERFGDAHMKAVRSAAPIVMWAWRSGPVTSHSVVLRHSKAFEIVDVLDFRQGKTFADLVEEPKVSAAEPPLEILRRFGPFSRLIHRFGKNDMELSRASFLGVGGEIYALPKNVLDAIPVEHLKSKEFRCAHELAAKRLCARELGELFLGNEIEGHGEFEGQLEEATAILRKAGYLPQDGRTYLGTYDLTTAAVEHWEKASKNVDGMKIFLEALPVLRAVFRNGVIDRAPIVRETLEPVLSTNFQKFRNTMTLISNCDLFDDAGKFLRAVHREEFDVERIVTNRDTGEMSVSLKNAITEETLTGKMAPLCLGYGKVMLYQGD